MPLCTAVCSTRAFLATSYMANLKMFLITMVQIIAAVSTLEMRVFAETQLGQKSQKCAVSSGGIAGKHHCSQVCRKRRGEGAGTDSRTQTPPVLRAKEIVTMERDTMGLPWTACPDGSCQVKHQKQQRPLNLMENLL